MSSDAEPQASDNGEQSSMHDSPLGKRHRIRQVSVASTHCSQASSVSTHHSEIDGEVELLELESDSDEEIIELTSRVLNILKRGIEDGSSGTEGTRVSRGIIRVSGYITQISTVFG
jgi:hypothetical protein